MSMQFWGVEVNSKVPNRVEIEFGNVIHLSQATLSDVKKDMEPVVLRVKVQDKDHVLGILSQSTPQLSFDLVFDTEFEISHNFKNGSVHFLGYQSEMAGSDDDMMSDDESDEEDVPVLQQENGVAAVSAPKPKVAAKPSKDTPVEDSDEDDSDDDSSDEDMGTPLTSEYTSDSDDDEEDDDDDDESDEDDKPAAKAPAKVESGKKRPNADAKTPESKKAKLVTPQKTDGKKGGAQAHTATPHPGKKGGKTPGDKTPKSAGQVSCDSCKKTFNSDVGLQSHKKAKHSAK